MNQKQAKRIRKFLQKNLDQINSHLTWRDRAEEWRVVRSPGHSLTETVPPVASVCDNVLSGTDLFVGIEPTLKLHKDSQLQMRLAANSPRGMYQRIKTNVSAARSR